MNIFTCTLAGLLFICNFSSCEVGLGGAVDTQPPSITIEYPNVDSVIRDVFAIGGNWSDDGTIASLTVTLKRTDGNGSEVKIPGECIFDENVSGSGTWHAVIDYSEKNLIDGTYQAIVSIKDKGKHETLSSTTFTIDNTAPVVVLSRPSTKASAAGFDSYGQTFTLEGKAADDNDVELIEVNIYDSEDSTTPIKTVSLTGIPLTIEQDVAVYKAGEANDYAVIYGHTDEDGAIIKEQILAPEERYCTLTIYDGAQRYPVDGSPQTEEDKKGNCTNSYYMNSEMDLILASYKINELYHIQNKTFEAQAGRTIALDSVIPQLEEKAVTKSKFSLFPANNPKFIVTSRSTLGEGKSLTDSIYQLTAGNSCLEVEITPGLDKFSIDPDSVGVYLYKANPDGTIKKDTEGNPLTPICLVDTGAENHTSDKVTIVQAGDTYKFKTVATISKNNFPTLNIGECYIVEVVGHDSQGEEKGKIVSDGIFGFQLISSDEKIELSGRASPSYVSTNEAAWEVAGHQKLTVTLSWSGGDNEFDIFRGNERVGTSANAIYNSSTQRWTFTDEIDYTKYNALGKPTSLDYTLKKNGEILSTTANISIQQDSEIPSVSNITFKNAYAKEETIQVNGQPQTKITYFVRNQSDNKCDIGGIATDDTGIERVEVVFDPVLTTAPVLNTGRFTFTNIDFSSITTAPSAKATIIATDVAGNQNKTENKIELDIVFDTSAPQSDNQQIDDASKNLVFRIGDAKNDAGDADVGGKYSTNTYGNALSIQVRGNFPDSGDNGSGIKKYYYWISPKEVKIGNKADTASEDYFADDAELIEYVKIHSNGTFAPLDETEIRWVEYNITRDDSKTYPTDYYDASNKEPKLGGIGIDGLVNGGTKKDCVQFKKQVTTNFKTTLKGFSEGKNYLVIVAEDNVGNFGLDTATLSGVEYPCYTLNVDIKAPTIPKKESANVYVNVSAADTDTSKKVYITGTASDNSTVPNASSGIKKIVFTSDAESAKDKSVTLETLTTDGLTTAEQTADSTLRTWKADVKSLLPSSGTAIISAKVIDVAGFETSLPVATIIVDSEGPDVTITSPESSSVNKNVVITGSSNDGSGAGIDTTKDPEIFWTTNQSVGKVKPTSKITPAAKAKDGWIKYTATPNKTGSNWSFTINTTTLKDGRTNDSGTEIVIPDETPVYFTVSSMDLGGKKVTVETTQNGTVTTSAGEGTPGYSSPLKLIVDQDTDRPVITLTQLSLYNNSAVSSVTAPVWFNRGDLACTITDDDGSVTSVKAIAKEIPDNTSTDTTPTESEWTAVSPITVKNGSFTFTFANNGAQKVYFRVEDAGGAIFTSSTTSSSGSFGPKIIDSEDKKFGYRGTGEIADDIIYVKVDTVDPILSESKYYASDKVLTTSEIAALQTDDWKECSLLGTQIFGGTNKRYLYIKFTASDDNGINAVTSKFGTLDAVSDSSSNEGNDYSAIVHFDLGGQTPYASGTANLTITIKDNAAAASGENGISKIFTTNIDNTPPTVSFSSHKTGAEVFGSSAVTLRGGSLDSNTVSKIEYAITKEAAAPADNSSDWTEITKNASNQTKSYTSATDWQLVFDGNVDSVDTSSYHAELLKTAMFRVWEITGQAAQDAAETKPVYIWIRSTDEFGNVSVNKDVRTSNTENFILNVIPNGDQPAVSIIYPEKGTVSAPVKLGGTIRINGTAEVRDSDKSISAVYVQIDPNYSGTFSNTWYESVNTLLVGVNSTKYAPVEVTGIETGYGIAVKGSLNNWYLPVNELGEFNSKIGNNNRKIAIRVVAISSSNKKTYSDEYICEVDAQAPTFGENEPLRFVNPAESASRAYESGLYLKGQWYLTGSIEDSSDISSIIITKTDRSGQNPVTETPVELIGSTSRPGEVTANSWSDTSKGYQLYIPIGNATADSYGEYEYEITCKDNSSEKVSNTIKFTVFFDNKKPSFTVDTGNSTTLAVDENAANTIWQSNGAYTVNGTFKEDSGESGFNRIAMYFTKIRGNDIYLIDPMVDDGADGDANWKNYKIATKSGNTITPVSGIKQKNGLFWREVEISKLESSVITLTATPSSLNIRAGGLCMINNVVYRIESVNNTNKILTLKGTLSDIATNAGATARTIYFALTQVIDHISQESADNTNHLGTRVYDYTTEDPITNQDGDYMLEGVKFANGGYTWNVSLDSSNMMDGKAKMTFVAFDAAGNQTDPLEYDMKISNNAPRIAGVLFGADRNMDGEITTDETISNYQFTFRNVTVPTENNAVYNGRNPDGELITTYNPYENTAERLVVKGKMMVKPEIVGGNTALAYTYTYTKKKDGGGTERSTTAPVQYANVGHSSDGSIRSDILSINLSLLKLLQDKIADGEQDMVFTIWDKTDGAEFGENGSESAAITLPVKIVIGDSVAPTAVVDPFHWNSDTDNSLYLGSKANGHIELENDLPTTTFTSGGNDVFDRDAKVSGKITFVGQATDNNIVERLTVKIPGYKSGAEIEIAKRDKTATTTAGWTSTNFEAAKSLNGENAVDWTFELINDTYDTSTGENIINFRFSFNTAQITKVAATNVGIEFKAYDKGSPALNETSTAYTYSGAKNSTPGTTTTATDSETGYYRVDIVPYITKISTPNRSKSGLKDNNIRSASGRYSIIKGNTNTFIKVQGFNLYPDTGSVRIMNETLAESIATTKTHGLGIGFTNISDDRTAFDASNSIAYSGYLELFVNNVRTLNNLNKNDAYGTAQNSSGAQLTADNATTGDYSNAYNREPDYYTTKNVQLTDDRYLLVFDMKDTGKKNAYYPNMIMDDNDPVFGFVDLNGSTNANYGVAQIRSGYQPQRAKFSGANGNQSSIEYLIGGMSWDQMAMVKDSAGKYIHASSFNYSGAHLSIVYNQFASQYTWDANGNAYYGTFTGGWGNGTGWSNMSDGRTNPTYYIERAEETGNNAISLESMDYGNGTLIGRYQNIKMVAKGNSTNANGASIYMAYYDDNTTTNDVIFRTFQIKQTNTNSWNKLGETGLRTNLTEDNNTGRIVVRPAGNTTIKGSKHLDVGVTSDNHVVVIFYDTEEGKLRMYYSSGTVDGSSITPSITWAAANVTFPSYVGTDVSMVIDGSNGIHITASDSTDSDLVYMYIPSYNSTTLKTIKVDQAFAVGTWTSIKVKGNTTDGYIPYIAYYNATETGSRDTIKLAYFADTTKKVSTADADTIQGVDSNGYTTGTWEYLTVPAITPPQGGDSKFRAVCLDFDSSGTPVVGYLGTNLEFGKWLGEEE